MTVTVATAMAMATAATAAMVMAMATSTAMEEEECDGCEGADPQRRLDNSLLRLVEVCLIAVMTVGTVVRRQWSQATATTSMPVIDIGTLFIRREDREGNGGSGAVTEDVNDANAEAGECASNFLEVVLCRLWEGRFGGG